MSCAPCAAQSWRIVTRDLTQGTRGGGLDKKGKCILVSIAAALSEYHVTRHGPSDPRVSSLGSPGWRGGSLEDTDVLVLQDQKILGNMSIMPGRSSLGTMPVLGFSHHGRLGLVCLEWVIGSGAHVRAYVSGTRRDLHAAYLSFATSLWDRYYQ